MENKTIYTPKEVIDMMQAYHNFAWALAENEFSNDSEARERARRSVDTKFREEYESKVPRKIRDGLHKRLAE